MTAADILRWALKGLRTEQEELTRVLIREHETPLQDWIALAEKILDLRREERQLEALLPLAPPLLPGDQVFGLVLDEDADVWTVSEDRVTGVGFKGFTLSEFLDDAEDMGAVVPWAELGQSYFTTREAAEAIARELNRIREEGAHD